MIPLIMVPNCICVVIHVVTTLFTLSIDTILNIHVYKDKYNKYQRVWPPKITIKLKNLKAKSH